MVFSHTIIRSDSSVITKTTNTAISNGKYSSIAYNLEYWSYRKEGITIADMRLRAILTLSLALTSAPDLINSSATSGPLLFTALCNGCIPSYTAIVSFMHTK